MFLLDIMKELVPKYPNFKLLIVGDGPDKELYEETVDKYKIKDNVIMTGKVAWDDVPIYYQLASVFITASKTETQGLTVIESMAASIPPICIDDDSFRNTVVDGLNGRIFKTKKECKNSHKSRYGNVKNWPSL